MITTVIIVVAVVVKHTYNSSVVVRRQKWLPRTFELAADVLIVRDCSRASTNPKP